MTPAGFIPVLKGWNVWRVWQVDDLGDLNPMNFGLSDERRLRIWVEEQANAAPGAAVADPANPLALKGGQVEIIPSADGLAELATLNPSSGHVLELPSAAHPFFVRFYNRGAEGVTPWPIGDEQLVEAVYEPSAASPITNGAPPSSLGGAATGAAETVKEIGSGALTAVVVVAAAAFLLALARRR